MTSEQLAPTAVDELAERFWDAILELNPTTATFYGDDRFADRLEDPGPAGRARNRALMERTAAEASEIATDGLPTEDRITRDMLRVIAELQIGQIQGVASQEGPQVIGLHDVPVGTVERGPEER